MRYVVSLLLITTVCLTAACGREQIAGPTPPRDEAAEPPSSGGEPQPPAADAPAPAPAEPQDPATPADPQDPAPPADPQEPPPAPPPPPPPPPPPTAPVVLVGAGDIGVCDSDGPVLTAALLDSIDGIVFTAGDNAYRFGTREDFERCYHPTWGRHRWRTRPSPGNHDYRTEGAVPYFDYFGERAGPAGRGYYRFEAGAWQVYSLNSNVPAGPGSTQLSWLRSELQAHPSACIAAIWHHALSSSGPYGYDPQMRDVWRALREAGADLVVTAHSHMYERFAPIDEDGYPSSTGIRAFVAGTGGAALYQVGQIAPGSQVRASVWGVLKLTLRHDAFDWEFVPVSGAAFTDRGSQGC